MSWERGMLVGIVLGLVFGRLGIIWREQRCLGRYDRYSGESFIGEFNVPSSAMSLSAPCGISMSGRVWIQD